jgi:hypothetical protein
MKESYTSLCVVILNDEYDDIKKIIEKNSSIMDLTAAYPLDKKYQVLEIDMMGEGYTSQQLFAFAVRNINGICFRQEDSTIIVAKNEEKFREMLSTCYTKDKAAYFFYDMLTIAERYELIMADPDAPSGEGHLLYNVDGASYSLILGFNCIYLFDSETEVRVEDDFTGAVVDIDMANNLDLYDFHIRILGKKLEKNN